MLVLKPTPKEDIVLSKNGKEIARLKCASGDRRKIGIEADKSILINRVPVKEKPNG